MNVQLNHGASEMSTDVQAIHEDFFQNHFEGVMEKITAFVTSHQFGGSARRALHRQLQTTDVL
jgi:hypothetical protein